MANWKKVIVAGAEAELLNIDVTNAVTASAFKGDGSALTGLIHPTYNVQDGQFSEVSFTALDNTKLGDIEADADITDTQNVVAALTAGANITIAADGTIAGTADTQDLSIVGHTISLTNGGSVTVPDNNTHLTTADVRGKFTAGANITIVGGAIAGTADTQLSTSDVRGKFTAGTNVSISAAGVISSIDTNTDTNTWRDEYILPVSVVHATEVGALHATDALRVSGKSVSLYKGDGSSETITTQDTHLSTSDVRGKFTAGANVSISAGGVISSTDTNTNTNTQLSGNKVKDFVGEMLDNNTETGINVTYDDATHTIDFVVATQNPSLGGDVTGLGSTNTVTKLQNVAITKAEVNQLANIGTSTISSTQWGYLGGSNQNVKTNSNVTHNNLTLTGNLDVQGTTTTLHTANLNIEDKFILLASGSETTVDAGIIFQNNKDGSGEAFVYDSATTRPAWSTTGVAFNATSVAPTSFIPRVFDEDASQSVINERGSIKIKGEDIFIYS